MATAVKTVATSITSKALSNKRIFFQSIFSFHKPFKRKKPDFS